MSGEDDTEKQHEPTQKKLDDARRKGEIPRSNDVTAALALGGLLLVLAFGGGWVSTRIGTLGIGLLQQAAWVEPRSGAFAGAVSATSLASALATAALPVFVVPPILVIVALLAFRGLVFAPDKLSFRLSRLSPISNAKNKFGRAGLFEFGKSAVKLLIVSAVLGIFLAARSERIGGTMQLRPQAVAVELGRLSLEFIGILVALLAVIGGLDLLWQIAEHRRRNRMSRKELQDETKDSEGDPHVKQVRRQRGQQIAMSSMLRDVGESSVVVVNPEHYAVALKWDPTFAGPPLCTAKGTDHVAARIREAAREAGVPIHRDPPTARAIHATVEIGAEILPEHYRPVAAAIRFAESMRQIARKKVLE
ncbi:EscU/YscU/HrcU family type III secretion system export apparatus switch protein [Tropicimonas sediminicola]|uniref:Flagellar biosynthetic protein FlhB n=1 Tax=Tropicimonas sediminicola TaxID=1031541 RepID=A0A239JDJ4_9RHOB|nr:flagellar type III secretion system protein FlhB [Tropicimonas sediminicola]SNT03915.1 flagellar biosynthetic protein FlhB [Tropicimonas sediminicola]